MSFYSDFSSKQQSLVCVGLPTFNGRPYGGLLTLMMLLTVRSFPEGSYTPPGPSTRVDLRLVKSTVENARRLCDVIGLSWWLLIFETGGVYMQDPACNDLHANIPERARAPWRMTISLNNLT